MKERITNVIRTFKAVSPILGRAVKSGQLFSPQCDLTELVRFKLKEMRNVDRA